MFCRNILPIFVAIMSLIPAASAHDIIIEAKGAYFLPINQKFRKIYHNGGGIYGLEATFMVHKYFYGFLGADFFRAEGHSMGFDDITKATIVNIELGAKCFIPVCIGNAYVGLGILPTMLHTHDDSPYIVPNQTEWDCGGIAKLGIYIDLPGCCVLDLFVDYSFVTIHFTNPAYVITESHNAHLSGCWFGGGLGYRF